MKYLLVGLLFASNVLSFNVQKNDVSSMIDQMVAKGVITAEDAKKAKSKMGTLTEKQWDEVNKQGREVSSAYGANNKEVDASVDGAAKNIDFDSEAFKNIQKMMGETLK